jgi:predicted nucleotidyltransferase
VVEWETVADAVRETARACGAEKAIVFGSFARGTATAHSDLDVLFVEQTSARFLDRLERYMRLLFDRLGIPAEVLVYTPDEYERMQGGPFMSRIAREGRLVYECRETPA